jgi:hypothetical protein
MGTGGRIVMSRFQRAEHFRTAGNATGAIRLQPHPGQWGRWTHRSSPHAGHVHFVRSASTKRRIPTFRMAVKLPIMLIPYRVRYRLSKFLSRRQGNAGQAKQNRPVRFSHRRIRQSRSQKPRPERQPSQAFFARSRARQRAQFIPQTAIDVVFMGIGKKSPGPPVYGGGPGIRLQVRSAFPRRCRWSSRRHRF